MKEYDQCQRMKNRAEMSTGKLKPNKILKRLWQYILMDFITKLLVSKDYNSILVDCDRFLKNVTLCRNDKKNNSREVGKSV